jgi:hypothetical protein
MQGTVVQSGKGRTRKANTSATALTSNLVDAGFGLLDGNKADHATVGAPSALVETAKRDRRPDPVAAFFRRTEGRLGPDHNLDC